jgi:hypothetical protein
MVAFGTLNSTIIKGVHLEKVMKWSSQKVSIQSLQRVLSFWRLIYHTLEFKKVSLGALLLFKNRRKSKKLNAGQQGGGEYKEIITPDTTTVKHKKGGNLCDVCFSS